MLAPRQPSRERGYSPSPCCIGGEPDGPPRLWSPRAAVAYYGWRGTGQADVGYRGFRKQRPV